MQTWEAGLLATTAEDPPDAVGGEGPARPRFLHQCCNPIATTFSRLFDPRAQGWQVYSRSSSLMASRTLRQ